jgi:hypothetical protein
MVARAGEHSGPGGRALRSVHGGPVLHECALLSATSPSFVLTATDIGVRIGKLRELNATALVGAAVVAMVIFPSAAQSLLPHARSRRAAA